jgi:uncharacterized protein YyaL (SSP411 family)
MPENTNHLTTESSLYLQQHAHNPVDWYPWSDEAWEKAKKENKLVLVSIGYSSCHWCHVMEHETFTDSAAAKFMNDRFICIKVDREERPDIDQIYMTAVQLMTGSGGWPLNCFTLPDGRPIYGGTYFPKPTWMQLLAQLDSFYRNNPKEADTYATELTNGLSQSELFPAAKIDNLSDEIFPNLIESWKKSLDNNYGGQSRAPKFPMPGNYQFLLRYAVTKNDEELLNHVKLTLNKMAYGGIYDHLAGAFARYSTDTLWKVPHFEKMLYDNAQLISLYSNAFKVTKDPFYKKIATETIEFLAREMSDGKGGYYSAIDADSEGEEGKYYVWKKEEFNNIHLPELKNIDSYSVLYDYYSVNDFGYWEKGNYILIRNKTDDEIANKYNLTIPELQAFISKANESLLAEREKRIKPALDRKIITSWNALMVNALCTAGQAFSNEKFTQMAVVCAEGILSNRMKDGMLLHVRDQRRVENGYLEDYAFTITSFIHLYQTTLDEKWLNTARHLVDDAIKYFYDKEDGFFYYTAGNSKALIARKKEITDNVIPGSNSEMANALFLIGDYYGSEPLISMARRMAGLVEENIVRYPSSHSNWLNLYLNFLSPFAEIVVSGEKANGYIKKLSTGYLPNVILAGAIDSSSTIPLFENRYKPGITQIYICRNRTCNLPVEKLSEAIAILKKESVYLGSGVDYSE